MSDLITISATRRENCGKNFNRQLRIKNLIPGNLLGKPSSTSITIDPKWLSKAWLGGRRFNLDFEGQTKVVEIKELQLDAVKRRVQHVDLMYV